jgi:hypothetical protein
MGGEAVTDRLKGVVVTFETDLRTDDAEAIIEAIKMLRGVATVSPSVTDISDHMNRMRVRQELGQALWKVLYPEEKP